MTTYDSVKTEIIYKLFGNMEVTGLGGNLGSDFIGDFLNSKILHSNEFDSSVFDQLGRAMYKVYKRELDARSVPKFSTSMNTNQYVRLAQVEKKLDELKAEINCIRNND